MLSLQIKLGTFSSTLLEGVRSTPYLSRRYKSKRRALPCARRARGTPTDKGGTTHAPH